MSKVVKKPTSYGWECYLGCGKFKTEEEFKNHIKGQTHQQKKALAAENLTK